MTMINRVLSNIPLEDIHPLIRAVIDEAIEHSDKVDDEKQQLLIFLTSLKTSIRVLNTVIDSSLSKYETLTLDFRGYSCLIHPKDELKQKLEMLDQYFSDTLPQASQKQVLK